MTAHSSRFRTDSAVRDTALVLLLVILALAAFLRLSNLIPLQRGLQAQQDYDEAVWDGTAQLLLQGYLPYRDFFATLPPVGIYLLAGVLRLFYVPWGSGVGLMATRYASVLYALLSIGLVYVIGRRLAGRGAGLVAAGLLTIDGMVISTDRLAMLEPPLNLFSLLALWVYLRTFDRLPEERAAGRGAAWAGALAAVVSLVKTQGLVVILALVTVSLLRRRWREIGFMLLGFALAWLACSAYFLVQCPDQMIKQVYFFQFLRPPDGVVHRLTRLYDMWHYESAWLALRMGMVGGLYIAVLTLVHREVRAWWAVLAWAGYSMFLILANGSYYPQYYVQLAVPLCILGGSLLNSRVPVLPPRCQFMRAIGAVVLIVMLWVGLANGQLRRQTDNILGTLTATDSTYTDVANYIRDHSAPDACVLVFEPNYVFLASRAPSGAATGRFLLDSYGEMLYVNLGIAERPWYELLRALVTGKKSSLQSTFWAQPAQEQVLAAFERADYVVIDGRARYQLQPQTLATIQARSSEEFSSGVATLRKRR